MKQYYVTLLDLLLSPLDNVMYFAPVVCAPCQRWNQSLMRRHTDIAYIF